MEILFSTSFDDKYPPTDILNNTNTQFWTSTGLYPQEVFIKLDNEKTINITKMQSIAQIHV